MRTIEINSQLKDWCLDPASQKILRQLWLLLGIMEYRCCEEEEDIEYGELKIEFSNRWINGFNIGDERGTPCKDEKTLMEIMKDYSSDAFFLWRDLN